MEKIVKAVPQNLALYTLTALNLLYAIHKRSFDWLLWASVGAYGSNCRAVHH